MGVNKLETQMVQILKQLKSDYGVVGLKAEFEAEASRMEELMRLKEICTSCDLGLLIKIGGAEDISHMFDALNLGMMAMNAPMIETPFAASKFFKSVKKYIPAEDLEGMEISINIETFTAQQNLDGILNHKDAKVLTAITVGRVDMTDSLGLTREEINSPRLYQICEEIFSKARKKGLKTGLGGGISTDAIDFIKRLGKQGLIDKYETRKIIFTNMDADPQTMAEGVLKAVEFETLWLENKRNYHLRIGSEDDTRIEMLRKRLNREITNSDKTC
jgi:4-hydroxy-2-oxoheptanedioate aldolase